MAILVTGSKHDDEMLRDGQYMSKVDGIAVKK